MKKRVVCGIVLAMMLSGCSIAARSSSGKDELAGIQEKGEITIGLEGTWKPFSYHDDDNRLDGSDVETGKAIARKLGVKAKIEEAPVRMILSSMVWKKPKIGKNHLILQILTCMTGLYW